MDIHALWCHPRSVSTAFERIMRERGDLAVLHEPFMYHYYLTTEDRLFPDFVPEPGHPATYEEIRESIIEKSRESPVFFKDMAYYVADVLFDDIGFARKMSHAFLLRSPVEAALSYAKRDPEFTVTELGHEAQHRLYNSLVSMGLEPIVLTADQLRNDPEGTMRRYWAHIGFDFADHAFVWDKSVPEGWKSVQGWHKEVLKSGEIKMPSPKNSEAELEAIGSPYTDYAAHHMRFYEEMSSIAESQAHQK